MKGIVYTGPNALEVRELPMPEVPEGWALVKVHCAGICGTDLNIFAGGHPRAQAPLVMGHEFSGVMAEDAPGFKKGDRVTVYPLLSDGTCTPCQNGNGHVCNDLKLLGIDCDGAMGEYVAVPVDSIIPLGDDVSDELGAFVEPVAVAVHTIRECNFVFGDNAVIFGCGAIGMVIAVTLRLAGAGDIKMVENDPLRASRAREMGFDVVDPGNTDIPAWALENTGGDGFDWVFDCAGVQAVANLLLDVVKVKGRIIVVAGYKKPAEMPFIKGMFKEVEIKFVRVYRKKDFAVAAACIGKDPAYEKIITHVLPVESAQEGFDLLTTPGTGAVKVMYKF